MCVCHYFILSKLHTYDTAATLLSTSILSTNLSTNSTDNLSAAVTTYLSAAASGNLSAEINSTKLKIIDSSSPTNPQFFYTISRILRIEFRHWNYLSLLVTTEDAQPNNPKINQQPTLTSNILPATITKNKLLDTIFSFKLEEPLTIPLFNGATLEEKPIMVMYTDVKINGHSIKLILDIDHAASTRIIITNEATKTSIGEINNFPIEVNGIMVPIKVLVIEAIQYQALVGNDWLSKTNALLD
ncbi:hypothetical protein G9A89_006429 [Geosiphon pyriformis]|nr:hypothetical protein G9A89_006429 [Geosiphon pyriformis]